jgi:antitoxin component of RelBE/YafQ-DinJ toxin-antitoxin module
MTFQEKKKLTLRLNKRLIEQAKEYAARHNISVSELVETFFLRLEDVDEKGHTQLVRQLTGILPEEVDVEKENADHLMEKYGQ